MMAYVFCLDMDSDMEMILPVCADKHCKTSLVMIYPNVLVHQKVSLDKQKVRDLPAREVITW